MTKGSSDGCKVQGGVPRRCLSCGLTHLKDELVERVTVPHVEADLHSRLDLGAPELAHVNLEPPRRDRDHLALQWPRPVCLHEPNAAEQDNEEQRDGHATSKTPRARAATAVVI
jgi:hypothetical protein